MHVRNFCSPSLSLSLSLPPLLPPLRIEFLLKTDGGFERRVFISFFPFFPLSLSFSLLGLNWMHVRLRDTRDGVDLFLSREGVLTVEA